MPRRLFLAAATIAALLVVAPAAHAGWIWPVRGEVITAYENGDDPYAAGQHRGIDVAAPIGTPVVVAVGGRVRYAGTAGSSGLTVSIRTADGRFDTSYLHLSSIAVREGDDVSTGERLGAVGTTGQRSADASHLHFGVRAAHSDHGYHDPLAFLPPAPIQPEHPRPAPAPHRTPVPLAPEPPPAAAPGRVGPRASGPATREAPFPHPRRLPLPAPRAEPAPHADSALDLGDALACAGLLLAAGLLGLSEDRRQATHRAGGRSRDRIAATLRPLLGRR
jgi:murein DD-endopeptidase MepM/ murein hydrolase activator NlpD